MANLEQLVAGHAYWSDKWKELKTAGSLELDQCNGKQREKHTAHPMVIGGALFEEGIEVRTEVVYFSGETCIEVAYKLSGEHSEGAGYYGDMISFEEVWDGHTDDFEPCEHCRIVRDLKRERGVAGSRLGSIRAAMTRVGRTIDYEAKGN